MFKPVSPKVDFPNQERELLKKWYSRGIIKKYLHKNDSAKQKFSFLDGPITANNPMGVHHAWGRTYKDLWQRFWNMKGFRQRFQNGFDEQGLWVEVEVEKELGLKSKKDIENLIPNDRFKSLEKFVNLCKERVKKYSAIQTEQSQRLGYFMDWDNSYHTSSDQNNYAIWNFLKIVNEKGWLYKGRDSVPWCPRCGTAISQHEILTEEYKELTHKTVVVKFPITSRGWGKTSLLAWTTTPWTLPGNVALAVDPNLFYQKMTSNKGENIILVSPQTNEKVNKETSLIERLGLTKGWEKTEELKGRSLIGLEYEGIYDELPAVKQTLGNYCHRVISADPQILPIDPADGTGIVHIAPGAGAEDFQLHKKEDLPVIEEIDEAGVFLEGFGFLTGLGVKEAASQILNDLEKRGSIHGIYNYLHRYPTCWRCKTELVWRVVDEWYIAMDKPLKSKGNPSTTLRIDGERSRTIKSQKSKLEGKTFRELMVEVAKKINWIPKWGLERELDWLSNMHDWLISKKRYWGLALPIWECQNCGNFMVVGGYEELKEKAVEGWDKFEGNSPHRPWVDQVKIKCDKCGEKTSRILDVGNPWLDAGIVSFSTMPKDWFPADFITESFPGQFKNWFYSLIAMSTAIKNTNPFRTVLGFASVRDEKGEEMHKSKGNAIEFNEAADKIGVDVMRWMYARQNPEQNLNFGYKAADEVRRQFHLMLLNIYNFFVTYANIDKWENKSQIPNPKSQNILDRWILSRLNQTVKTVSESLEKYNTYTASREIENLVSDLSLWYVRRSRERVGPACYQTLFTVLVTLSKLLACFTPFLSDEIYTNLTGSESVHLADWPEYNQTLIDRKLEEEMREIRKIVELGHAQRKRLGIKVRQPLAKFKIQSRFNRDKIDEELISLIRDELNVKEVEWVTGKGELAVEFETTITPKLKAEGEAREIIRKIQEERKKLGTKLDEKVDVVIEEWPEEFEDYIKKKALVRSLLKGEKFLTRRI